MAGASSILLEDGLYVLRRADHSSIANCLLKGCVLTLASIPPEQLRSCSVDFLTSQLYAHSAIIVDSGIMSV